MTFQPAKSPTTETRCTSRTLTRLRDVPAAAWDALFDPAYPFTTHAFLSALEEHGCVGGRSGWQPCHLIIEDDAGQLAGAMPLYRKEHSYGEFVFDFAWARASQQLGRPYYPKLINAIPFTPASGPRFGARSAEAEGQLLDAAVQLWCDSGCSSLHALFLQADAADRLGQGDALARHDIQFQWCNRGDASFTGFLQRLRHDKRKKIMRERRRVAEAGLRFEWRCGDELDEAAWAQVFAMYRNTYEERGQPPYLSLDFFLDYGRRAGTPLRLCLAYDGAQAVAVALNAQAGASLYGRHWGCAEKYHSLHFETCYYQGIERCLQQGLQRFDAGTQGDHKLARGFDPVVTRSAHFLADARLRSAVGDYLQRERKAVAQQVELLMAHSAYRSETNHHG